jgi:hypothetical protein
MYGRGRDSERAAGGSDRAVPSRPAAGLAPAAWLSCGAGASTAPAAAFEAAEEEAGPRDGEGGAYLGVAGPSRLPPGAMLGGDSGGGGGDRHELKTFMLRLLLMLGSFMVGVWALVTPSQPLNGWQGRAGRNIEAQRMKHLLPMGKRLPAGLGAPPSLCDKPACALLAPCLRSAVPHSAGNVHVYDVMLT